MATGEFPSSARLSRSSTSYEKRTLEATDKKHSNEETAGFEAESKT
jgi:hypothetical protein